MVCRKQDSQNIRPCEISSAGSPKSRGVSWASEPKGQRFCGHGGSPLGRLRLRLGLASVGCVGSLKSPKKSMVSIQQRYSLTRQRSELGHKGGHTKVLILCELQDRSAVLVTATAWALCPYTENPIGFRLSNPAKWAGIHQMYVVFPCPEVGPPLFDFQFFE